MRRNWIPIVIGLLATAISSTNARSAEPPKPKREIRDTAADVVTLKDGSVVLGQVVDTPPNGGVRLLVSRAWAKENQAEALKRWEKAEEPTVRHAVSQRLERLKSWKQDREAHNPALGSTELTKWIDEEIQRLEHPDGLRSSPLMRVRLASSEIALLDRAPKSESKFLHLAWLSGFHHPEELTKADLKDGLEGRGFDVQEASNSPLDKLLPPNNETEAAWLIRRAATEVLNDPQLRLIDVGGFVSQEPKPGKQVDLASFAIGARSSLRMLLGGGDIRDTLEQHLDIVAKNGRVGAVVTQLVIDPEMRGVDVEMALWVRSVGSNWIRAGGRKSEVNVNEIDPQAGNALAEDPQVKLLFQVANQLGLGEVSNEMKNRSLRIGGATQKALGQTRDMANADLDALALPIR